MHGHASTRCGGAENSTAAVGVAAPQNAHPPAGREHTATCDDVGYYTQCDAAGQRAAETGAEDGSEEWWASVVDGGGSGGREGNEPSSPREGRWRPPCTPCAAKP